MDPLCLYFLLAESVLKDGGYQVSPMIDLSVGV